MVASLVACDESVGLSRVSTTRDLFIYSPSSIACPSAVVLIRRSKLNAQVRTRSRVVLAGPLLHVHVTSMNPRNELQHSHNLCKNKLQRRKKDLAEVGMVELLHMIHSENDLRHAFHHLLKDGLKRAKMILCKDNVLLE